MPKKQKQPRTQTEAEIFSKSLIDACEKFGTKTVAEEMGVTMRSIQVWKIDASKMNKISMIGARDVINNIYSLMENVN